MVKEYELVGIAIENDCAIEFVDNTYRVIATRDNANVHRVVKKGTKIIKEIILKHSSFTSVYDLMCKNKYKP